MFKSTIIRSSGHFSLPSLIRLTVMIDSHTVHNDDSPHLHRCCSFSAKIWKLVDCKVEFNA